MDEKEFEEYRKKYGDWAELGGFWVDLRPEEEKSWWEKDSFTTWLSFTVAGAVILYCFYLIIRTIYG